MLPVMLTISKNSLNFLISYSFNSVSKYAKSKSCVEPIAANQPTLIPSFSQKFCIEFINSIQNFCEKEGIKVGWLAAIGSTQDLDLAYFDTELKEYEIKKFKEFLEIVSITGNITLKENKVFCHAHGLFGREDMS